MRVWVLWRRAEGKEKHLGPGSLSVRAMRTEDRDVTDPPLELLVREQWVLLLSL